MKKLVAFLVLFAFLAGSQSQVFAAVEAEHGEVEHDDEEGSSCEK